MKELSQQMYWVHNRGIQTLLSPHATERIAEATSSGVPLPPTESARLRVITNDHNLKTRFPEPAIGHQLMNEISNERREELLDYAQQLSPRIVEEWEKINDHEPIAVIVYGSVAKGLVKPKEHDDPSDLDVSVIGNITEEERRKLLDASVPHRELIQKQMGVTPPADAHYPAFSCFKVRDVKTVLADNYAQAKKLIASSAFSLHDPDGIWQAIEDEVLTLEWNNENKKTRGFYKKSAAVRDLDTKEKEISRIKRQAPETMKVLPTQQDIFVAKQIELPHIGYHEQRTER